MKSRKYLTPAMVAEVMTEIQNGTGSCCPMFVKDTGMLHQDGVDCPLTEWLNLQHVPWLHQMNAGYTIDAIRAIGTSDSPDTENWNARLFANLWNIMFVQFEHGIPDISYEREMKLWKEVI